MKRIVAIILSMIFVISSLTACQSSDNSTSNGNESTVNGDAQTGGLVEKEEIDVTDVSSANKLAKSVYSAAVTYCSTLENRKGRYVDTGLYTSEDDNEFTKGVEKICSYKAVWKIYIENGAPYIAIATSSSDNKFIGSFPFESKEKSNVKLSELYPSKKGEHIKADGNFGMDQ